MGMQIFFWVILLVFILARSLSLCKERRGFLSSLVMYEQHAIIFFLSFILSIVFAPYRPGVGKSSEAIVINDL